MNNDVGQKFYQLQRQKSIGNSLINNKQCIGHIRWQHRDPKEELSTQILEETQLQTQTSSSHTTTSCKSLSVTGFCSFLWVTFIILTRDGLLYKMGVEVAIYNSVPKYFQKHLKKNQLSKPSAFPKGQFGALFDMNHYGWENKRSFVIQLEVLLCRQCLTILSKYLWNYHPKDNFVKIITLKKVQVLKKHLVLINCNYCNFTMCIYKFSLQSQ